MTRDYRQMRLGLFVHYVYFDVLREYGAPIGIRADGTPVASLDELADGLDVENLADAAASMRAEYVIFTAWHANMNALFPCAAIERLRPGHCSRRDVIADLISALERRGIALMLYIHPSDGHDFTASEQDLLGWNEGVPYRRWNDFMNCVLDETARRYRGRVIGYWADGGLPPPVDQAIDRLRETIRRADPNAVVVQNECFDDNHYRRWADFGCRELIRYPFPCEAMAAAGFITNWWAMHAPLMLSPELAFQYTVLQAAVKDSEGGGVAWAAGPYPGGTWEKGVEDFFARLGGYVEAIRPALFGTRPSQAFVTKPKTSLMPPVHVAATESADGNTTYVHVLRPPVRRELVLPPPADGRAFRHASLLANRHPVALVQDGGGVRLTLAPTDGWAQLDTVIQLTRRAGGQAL